MGGDLQEMNIPINLYRRAFQWHVRMTLEISAVCKDADQSARMYVCFACGLKLSKQDAFNFHPERDKNLEKNIQN